MGEQKSSVALTNYLNEQSEIPATALVGAKLPIKTNKNHGEAEIVDINTTAIKKCLDKGLVTIIPGFIGLTEDGETTTLGLDGSDTTAAFVAGYLGVDECRLYKDVTGVFTANPRRVPTAKKIDAINTESMLTFSKLGARILHPKALEAALKYNMTIRVLPNFTDSEGTVISTNAPKNKIVGITYWQHEKDLITISIVGNVKYHYILKVLKEHNINAREFKTDYDKVSTTILLDNPNDLNNALQIVHTCAGLDDENAGIKTAQMSFFDPGLIQN
jgi:aspartate kinase